MLVIAQRLDAGHELVRSESAKHRAAVASVISSVAIAILYVVVSVDVFDQLGLPIATYLYPAIFSSRAIRSVIGGWVENSLPIFSLARNGLAIIRWA